MSRKSKREKPIALGNGKFCYAGPNCRVHATFDAEPVQDKTNAPKIVEMVEDQIQAFQKVEQAWICNQPKSLNSLDNKQKVLLDSNSGARWCLEHNTYHIYLISELKAKLYNPYKSEMISKLLSFLKTNQNGLQDTNFYNHYISAKMNNLTPGIRGDLKTIESLDPENFQTFVNKVEEDRKRHIATGQGGHHQKVTRTPIPLLLKENQVSDEIMLEFWRCDRKQKYVNFDEAEFGRKATDPTGHVYKCLHCDGYHIGHGDGKGTEEATIRKARSMWHRFPKQANNIVRKHNLV